MGRLMKKHHLQLTLSVKNPPSSGPATFDTPQTLPSPVSTTPSHPDTLTTSPEGNPLMAPV